MILDDGKNFRIFVFIECWWTDLEHFCSPFDCVLCWIRSKSVKFRPLRPLRWPLRRVIVLGTRRGTSARSILLLASTTGTSKREFDFVSSRALIPIPRNVSTTLGYILVNLKRGNTSIMFCARVRMLNLPVSTLCIGCPVSVFQNRIHRSAVPPPLAKSPWWCGDHAIAFTAAICSEYDCTGLKLCWFHTWSRLSLPPLARYWLSGDHLRPQTSWRCPTKRRSVPLCADVRVSRCSISLSRDPLDRMSPFQASAPTRAEWPSNLFTYT